LGGRLTRAIWCGRSFGSGGFFYLAKSGLFVHDLLRTVFHYKSEDSEEQGGKHTAYRGIEDGVFEIFSRHEAHQQGEEEADKASDEREILHVGWWIRRIASFTAIFAPKMKC
jgi:hypothetical protein